MVSWINSNFAGWGSGITVPGYGFILHNRGGLFTLDPNSPNVIAPQKRPYNTLSAVLVMQNDRPLLVTGQHGGDQQGQGNMQVLVNVLDLHANVQAAGDMARFSHNQVSNRLQLEAALFGLVGAQLSAMGHQVASSNGSPGMSCSMRTGEGGSSGRRSRTLVTEPRSSRQHPGAPQCKYHADDSADHPSLWQNLFQ